MGGRYQFSLSMLLLVTWVVAITLYSITLNFRNNTLDDKLLKMGGTSDSQTRVLVFNSGQDVNSSFSHPKMRNYGSMVGLPNGDLRICVKTITNGHLEIVKTLKFRLGPHRSFFVTPVELNNICYLEFGLVSKDSIIEEFYALELEDAHAFGCIYSGKEIGISADTSRRLFSYWISKKEGVQIRMVTTFDDSRMIKASEQGDCSFVIFEATCSPN